MALVRTLLCAVFLVGGLGAQQPTRVLEPQVDHVAFYLDPAHGSLLPLERQPITPPSKPKGLGLGSTKVAAVFNGAKSPVRFKADQPIQFVMRIDTQGEDLSVLIDLDALSPTKKTREIHVAKAGGDMGSHSPSTAGLSTLSVDIGIYGEHSVKFVPVQSLGPGEYLITAKGSKEGFLFGID